MLCYAIICLLFHRSVYYINQYITRPQAKDCPMKFSIEKILPLLCCLSITVYGAEPADYINQINPGRYEQNLAPEHAPLSSPDELEVKPEKQQQTLPESVKKYSFIMKTLIIKGNTALTDQDLAPLYQDKIGKKITVAELYAISNKITQYYREKGYVLVHAFIPKQAIGVGGKATIQVVEGHIDGVTIQGDVSKATQKLLTQYGEKIQQSKPINISELERYSLLANDIPGVTTKVILAPSSKAGAADLVFDVKQEQLTGKLEADNRATNLYGDYETTLAGYWNGTFPGSQIGLSTTQSLDWGKLQYYQLAYQQVLSPSGWTAYVVGSYTKTKPDMSELGLNDVDLPGESTNISTTLRHTFIRSRNKNLFWDTTLDGANSNTDFSSSDLYNDHIRSIRTSISFDFTDKLHGTNLLYAQASQGLKMLGAEASPPSNPNGHLDYTKINGFVSRQQRLSNKWSMFLAADGQYAGEALLSSEKFGYGGENFGYAYDPSEITGDQGFSTKTELRYTLSGNNSNAKIMQIFGYFDIGKVWNIDTDNSEPASENASSAGGGLRFAYNKHITGSLMVGVPLTKNVTNEGNKDPRVFFSLAVK